MAPQELARRYEERQRTFQHQLAVTKRRINAVSNLRLLTAALLILIIYIGFSTPVWLYALPLPVVLFALLVQRHGKLFAEREHLENLVQINTDERLALEGAYRHLPTGAEFLDPHHPYAHDLDLFGEGSLYQYTNRCNTLMGRRGYANRLLDKLPDRKAIEEEQRAVQELAPLVDFRQHFQAAGKEIGEQAGDREQLLSWLSQKPFLFGKPGWRFALVIVPIITVALLLGWTISIDFRPYAILMVLVQWALLTFHLKRVNAFHESIGRKKSVLQKYAGMFAHLEQASFSSPALSGLARAGAEASRNVRHLSNLVHAFDARSNAMTTLFANSALLYDLQFVYRLEAWRERHRQELPRWLDALSALEITNSLATFAFNHGRFAFPTIVDELRVEATGMAHPLLAAREAVPNNISLGGNPDVMIITGANMAGKSTFLRTLGVNLVLALNGAPVNASSFSCPVITLRTGMRTADSLKDHQSYFYAELDRLKSIMDDLRGGRPMLILLDEILKGTNSTDKLTGSIALVRQLLEHRCLAIIATHDLALGNLEQEYSARVHNFCFEPSIENDQLSFDYKLKRGLAQKMNATFLMKKMGIIPS